MAATPSAFTSAADTSLGRSGATDPTPADQVVLRALFDPRMTPGLPAAEARGRARAIITEIAARGG